jgi:hypothetical protein
VIYKPLDREAVYQNPRIDLQKAPFGSGFDNVWFGGCEEKFPTAVLTTINGAVCTDQAEIWSLAWTPWIEQGKSSVVWCA